MKGICIIIRHEGIFSYDPLSYDCGDVEIVENVDLRNTSYERLMKIVKECCLFPVYGMYFCAPKVDIGKQKMERDPKAWCRAHFQMDWSCAPFENVAAYCMLDQDPGEGMSSWYSKQVWVNVYSNFIKPVGCSSIWVKSANPPPLPPKKRIMPGHNKVRCYNQTRPKPQQKKRKPGRKSQHAENQQFNPPNADTSLADLSAADPSSAAKSDFYRTIKLSNLYSIWQSMSAEITDAEIAALAYMNEVEEREARRKDAERVLEEAKKMEVYRKRGAGGWRGPSQRIANQRRKKENPNGSGKKPDTSLDVSD
nr:zinc finger BED domain-containing protein RICESLEEPER 2 [Tanacetum cinerariifolium]